MGRRTSLLFALALFSALLSSQSGLAQLHDAILTLCGSMKGLLPAVSMLMVLVAAVVYAAGQIMGAETRARANVWATACMTGALIGMLISTIAPEILSAIYGGPVACDLFSP